MEKTPRLALIYGSTREGRLCDTIANWAAAEIEKSGGFALDRIDPADPDLFPSRLQQSPDVEVQTLRERLARADGFIVVTPEYNHGYPAPLKFLIDSAYAEWQAKPVGFVSYGGLSGGIRAVEQLRQVFAELHAVTLRDSVAFASAWELFDQQGVLREPARAEKSMARMLAYMRWWAAALRGARSDSQYTGIAA